MFIYRSGVFLVNLEMDRRRPFGTRERCDYCASRKQGGFVGQTVRLDRSGVGAPVDSHGHGVTSMIRDIS